MKMKSFAMLAVSSIVAASFAYIAPAMAEDAGASSPSMQAPADGSNQTGSQSNIGAAPGDTSTNSSDSNDSNNNTSNTSGSNTDEGSSPDTATGDDDY